VTVQLTGLVADTKSTLNLSPGFIQVRNLGHDGTAFHPFSLFGLFKLMPSTDKLSPPQWASPSSSSCRSSCSPAVTTNHLPAERPAATSLATVIGVR